MHAVCSGREGAKQRFGAACFGPSRLSAEVNQEAAANPQQVHEKTKGKTPRRGRSGVAIRPPIRYMIHMAKN